MTDDTMTVCPFCKKPPQFGLTKKTGCQLHGDPIQRVTLSCKNPYCHAKPCVVGGDRYVSGYESGPKFKECENKAKKLAIKYWKGADTHPAPDEVWGLINAAWKVVNRWNTPKWKDEESTAVCISELKQALSLIESGA